MTRKVLLIDDDREVREALGQTLELADLVPILAGSYVEAKDHIVKGFEGIIVTDVRMPGKDGFQLLEYTRSVDVELPVILLTGEADVPMAVRGISSGAFSFLEKPCAPKDFLSTVEKALKTRDLVLENRRLRREVETGDAAARILRGTSAQAHKQRETARAVARTSADVLITGEPGVLTHKLAEVVHLLSARSNAPFLKLPAAPLSSDDVVQAMTQAADGSLFLDEIAALSMTAQFTLLDLMEGHDRPRVMAGTYADLSREVEEGRFLPDLYYRLQAATIRIAPLRERVEDIPVLFRHYVDIACEQSGLPQPAITPEIIARLMAQDWPGNARALMNAAMRFVMGLAEGDDVADQDLGLVEQLAQVERSLLIEALTRHSGNATEAARALKLPRKTFYDKLTKYDLRPEAYRL